MENSSSDQLRDYYKFKELKVYSSTEWLADNKKKYRQVFDKYNSAYIYAELSFYNKLFDKRAWEVEIELRCFSLEKAKKELCSLTIKKKVSKYDSVVFVREGWGNKKEGAFWKKGTYYWEAYIDDEKVASKYFYVEDAGGELNESSNPYFSLESISLYEGQYDDVNESERKYYREFNSEKTRYIYAELNLNNENITQSWHCELFVKFYNEAKELKGQIIRLHNVKKGETSIQITAGWGSNVAGSWRFGKYSVEVIFLDTLIASIPLEVTDNFKDGPASVFIPGENYPVLFPKTEMEEITFDELLESLEKLVGLEEIKEQVKDHAQYLKFIKLRQEKGFIENDEINVHSAFIGNPGTGKTTVAKMMGKLYHKMGLLSKGHVHEVDRVDLVGEYIGQTAPKVREVIEKARGGVLFIDEAYSLARANDDTKDFGREVIEILIKELSNGPGDLSVIVAGYPKEMNHFLSSNPGLKSRFKHYFEFPDYLPQELSAISKVAADEKEIELNSEAQARVDELIVNAFRNRDNSFGNARYVHDLLDKAKINLGLRIMSFDNPEDSSKNDISIIIKEDIDNININLKKAIPNIPIDHQLLHEVLQELDELIGMKNIKTEIKEMVELVKYYKLSGKDVLNTFHLHTIFIGNPGTGKTTVARIMAKIYKALGIIEKGHIVETDRQGLVAGFIGQTAIKTSEKIDEALGGVLFIDEAYSLSAKINNGDYGNEAIQTLLKRMEDQRGLFYVFAAGYPSNMEIFLKSNPGLKSRFDKILKFEDYSPDDLSKIAKKMFKEHDCTLEDDARAFIKEYLNDLFLKRDKYFGNAREIRNLVKSTVKNLHLRIAAEEGLNPNLVTISDLKDVIKDSSNWEFKRSNIGF